MTNTLRATGTTATGTTATTTPRPVHGLTIVDVFKDTARANAGRTAMRWRGENGWESLTWAEYERAVTEVATALRRWGLAPGDRVGVLAANRPEWHIADIGTLAAGLVTVPVYQTNAASQVGYVLAHSGARMCFVENLDQLAKVLLRRNDLPALERVIVMEDVSGLDDGFIVSLAQLRAAGAASPHDPSRGLDDLAKEIAGADLATLVYTSGTTGPPKGTMITHANVMATMRSLTSLVDIRPDDRFLSFLPLSHITERSISNFGQIVGGSETWFARSVATVLDDLQACRPTILFAVPRVWEKFQDGILEHVAAQRGVSRLLADRYLTLAATRSAARSRRGSVPGDVVASAEYQVLDRVVGRAIRHRLGLDRARIVACGAAPVHPDLLRWFHGIGLPIAEGYGQTEVSLCTSTNTPDDTRVGTVGRPIPGVSVRIADDGEIQVRGDNVCAGYWNDDAATAELIDADGWMHTGDLGRFDTDGYLQVTGRKKDLIITAYGKNISPEEIETALRMEPLIAQAVVVGDGRPYLTALVTVDAEAVADWAQHEGRSLDVEALSEDPGLRAALDQAVERVNASHSHAEAIRRWRVLPRELTLAGGELTPTLKVKRNVVVDRWSELIAEMYATP
jgi:long-chain acyl-CoA synthetase